MKLKSFLLLGLFSLATLLFAQTNFRPGFVINNSGDTLFGQVDYRGDLIMGNVCKFKDGGNTVREYAPNDIAGYRFVDGKYYVSKDVDSKKYFLEYLVKGKVNVYYLRNENGDHYYLDKDTVGLTEITFKEQIRQVDDKLVLYQSQKHVGILNYFMQDAPGIQSRIKTIRTPEHQNLIKLAEDYHNAVCDGEKCVVYEKRLPLIKISPELVVGLVKFKNVEDFNDKFYLQVGVIGHIWMPRLNEKVFFRTGVLFSRLDIDGKKHIYKIPCQLEYIYPRGFFRPRFGYGLNFYRPVDSSVSFNFGGNIKLSESLFLSVMSDLEFESTAMVLPHNLFSHSVMVGLFYHF